MFEAIDPCFQALSENTIINANKTQTLVSEYLFVEFVRFHSSFGPNKLHKKNYMFINWLELHHIFNRSLTYFIEIRRWNRLSWTLLDIFLFQYQTNQDGILLVRTFAKLRSSSKWCETVIYTIEETDMKPRCLALYWHNSFSCWWIKNRLDVGDSRRTQEFNQFAILISVVLAVVGGQSSPWALAQLNGNAMTTHAAQRNEHEKWKKENDN